MVDFLQLTKEPVHDHAMTVYALILQDYLKLGPLELKLLNIQGKRMAIYKPKTPSMEEMRAQLFKPDEWPVTSNMLQHIKTDR